MDDATHQARLRTLGAALPTDLGAAAPALQQRHDGEEITAEHEAEAIRLHTMLEVAAAADGELADDEIHNLSANLQAWLQSDLSAEFLTDVFEDLADTLIEHGFEARLQVAAKALDAESRRVAYKLACVTVLCDLEVRDEELDVLGRIATAFEIPEAEGQATFDELDATVTALVQT
jgi:hypothetical protein